VTSSPRRVVAVVDPGRPDDPAVLVAARQIGADLARSGCTVVTGGLGGVMEAASQGAREAGGFVVGILPGEDASAANEFVDLAVPTGMGEGRNLLVVRMADVVVAVGGSWGTLAEVALARRRGTPVVSVSGWQVTGPEPDSDLLTVTQPAGAVPAVLELLSRSPTNCRK
jgi:uncharacterized protein (TIGR00725 family)